MRMGYQDQGMPMAGFAGTHAEDQSRSNKTKKIAVHSGSWGTMSVEMLIDYHCYPSTNNSQLDIHDPRIRAIQSNIYLYRQGSIMLLLE